MGSMANFADSTQPQAPLPLPGRQQREFEQGRDLARFIVRADQRLRRDLISVLAEELDARTLAQAEARARVAIRLGDPSVVAAAVEAGAQAMLIDVADGLANRRLDAGDWECYTDPEGARRTAKVIYEAIFNHLAATHLLGREER